MMRDTAQELIDAAEKCLRLLPHIRSRGEPVPRSAATCADYLKLARSLIRRSAACGGNLAQVAQNTAYVATFYKRIAALRYYCHVRMNELASDIEQARDEASWKSLTAELRELFMQMQALVTLQREGMIQPRQKRCSKRPALSGLPPDWRTTLCLRGAHGKYALALLVSSLTGARPYELVNGIEVWKSFDQTLGQTVVCLHIRGAKVKSHQGQPNRFISYSQSDSHPLVMALMKHLDTAHGDPLVVQIAKAVNFTVEVRRLARSLWPLHKESVTAYCFRHQWAADMKASGDADAVSRGLGHSSAKTRRTYGTAGQARTTDRLRPVRIEADRPVKGLRPLSSALAPRVQTLDKGMEDWS